MSTSDPTSTPAFHDLALALAWRADAGPRRVALPADRPLVLGRDPACDVVFDNLSVSRRHAQIAFDAGAFVLRALSRSSPTRLNGRVIVRDAVLKAGDTVQLAMVQLDVVSSSNAGGDETDDTGDVVLDSQA
ncbi:MAG: FHA domain-containing protein [Ardenticatenales bacterium]